MIDYLCENFSKMQSYLGETGPKNHLKMGIFMVAASPQNHFNIYNLGPTDAIEMKLTTNIYHYEAFHLV